MHPGAFLSRYCSIKIEASLSACPACVLRLCSIHRVVFLVRRLMSLAERRCSLFASRRYREGRVFISRVANILLAAAPLSGCIFYVHGERAKVYAWPYKWREKPSFVTHSRELFTDAHHFASRQPGRGGLPMKSFCQTLSNKSEQVVKQNTQDGN